ncbi:MAG: hypothetical protein H5T70_02665, partial [Chloroflexi bacterium]|nr:hypothetical protein [Chloroflexota bacterium]
MLENSFLMWALWGAPWVAIASLVGLMIRQKRRIKRLEQRLDRLLGSAEDPSLSTALEGHLHRLEEAARGVEALRTETEA